MNCTTKTSSFAVIPSSRFWRSRSPRPRFRRGGRRQADDRHPLAEVGSLVRRLLAGGARSDDDDVVLEAHARPRPACRAGVTRGGSLHAFSRPVLNLLSQNSRHEGRLGAAPVLDVVKRGLQARLLRITELARRIILGGPGRRGTRRCTPTKVEQDCHRACAPASKRGQAMATI